MTIYERTALAVIDYEYELTDAELELLIREMYRECSRYVFAFLRASELEGYRPAEREAETAYGKLCVLFSCAEFANQILSYYIKAETNCYVRNSAENDKRFDAVSEIMCGMRTAPLIAELPEQAAYALWVLAGSWSGAMELCGLGVLPGKLKQDRIKRYALLNVSPYLLPKHISSKLSPMCSIAVFQICDYAQKNSVCPSVNSVTKRYGTLFEESGISVKKVLCELGILEQPKTKEEHNRAVKNWKNRSRWWRESESYRELSRRGNIDNIPTANNVRDANS